MCNKRSTVSIGFHGFHVGIKGDPKKIRIDPCLQFTIPILNRSYKTLGCCCGHDQYQMSIVIELDGKIIDLMSGVEIPRKTRFYLMDDNGFYYIPEVVMKNEKSNS